MAYLDPRMLMERYCEVGRWYGDLAFVMRLPVHAMLELRDQAERIAKLENKKPAEG